MEWQLIADAALGLLVLMGGWVWIDAVSKITKNTEYIGKLYEKLEAHSKEDTQQFAGVLKTMNDYHVETLTRISGRWQDSR